jgi:cytochrome oxidase Cu insertion factor (SCO1/SenC/PrrC family)
MKRMLTSTTMAALLVAGCSREPETRKASPEENRARIVQTLQQSANPADPNNLYNVLAGYEFQGQDGQPVNLQALQTSLRNHFTTLTFGFGECEQYCPMINNVLGEVGKANPDMTSVVISVNPLKDGADQASRDAFMGKIKEAGVKHKVVILYPAQGGQLAPGLAPQIAIRSGSITNPEKPLDHSAKVKLYGPGGTPLKDKSGLRPAREFVEEWGPVMNDPEVKR